MSNNDKLKKVIEARKLRKDVGNELSGVILVIKENVLTMVDKALKEQFAIFDEQIKGVVSDNVEQQIENKKESFTPKKGKDYFDGDDGKTPTEEELKELIKPLIPKPIKGDDGETPTEEELLSLIKPLIPIVENGKDGSPDKPKEVANKLNTLEEEVEMKVIKGLKDYLKKLETNIFYKKGSGGGGGMGMPIHETFAVGSATTSITLSYEVAASGRAIFGLRYQGQTLHWGEHYTVSGKIITLLETLSDNTNLDISYIRK